MDRGLRPLLTVWIAWLVLMAGVNLATPLYAVYAHALVAGSVIAIGVLDRWLSLRLSVEAVAVALVLAALAGAVWQAPGLRDQRRSLGVTSRASRSTPERSSMP